MRIEPYLKDYIKHDETLRVLLDNESRENRRYCLRITIDSFGYQLYAYRRCVIRLGKDIMKIIKKVVLK